MVVCLISWHHFCVKLVVTHSEIRVDSIQPLFGPVSGGTRVTISGQYVGMSTISGVRIGHYGLSPDPDRLQLSRKFSLTLRIAVYICLGAIGLSGVVVRSRTSDSEVAGSSPTRTAFE